MIGPPLRYVSLTSVNFIYIRSGCFVLCRLKLEVLTDKEPGELEVNTEEEDKGQQGAEEGLLSSQPQPSTSQILLEEDLIIEQYDSD